MNRNVMKCFDCDTTENVVVYEFREYDEYVYAAYCNDCAGITSEGGE